MNKEQAPCMLVYVIDDDEAVRSSLSLLLRSEGHSVQEFKSAEDFLENGDLSRGDCAVIDIRMDGMDGLELQESLISKGVQIPTIIVTGHGDVALAVRAMKAGAIDFVEKPYEDEVLLRAVASAQSTASKSKDKNRAESAIERLSSLSPREREVLSGLMDGLTNKAVARRLGISHRTVEIHRANLMEKAAVTSLAQLVRLGIDATEKT
jgi:two-component system response regulator FixJ